MSNSQTRASQSNLYSNAPMHEYNDQNRNHRSSVMTSNLKRMNESIRPNIQSLCNKSQIKSVKVYKLHSDTPAKEKTLHMNLKTSRKQHKISSKIFKKFLKDYQTKVSLLNNNFRRNTSQEGLEMRQYQSAICLRQTLSLRRTQRVCDLTN